MFSWFYIKSQLYKGLIVSWKLFLNLCSLKWLNPSLNLVINLSPLGLWQLWTEFGDGRINLRMLVLKSNKLSAFLRPGSNLFYSMIVDGKNEFLKKLLFVLRTGLFSAFLVGCNVGLTGIKQKMYWGCSLFKTL